MLQLLYTLFQVFTVLKKKHELHQSSVKIIDCL